MVITKSVNKDLDLVNKNITQQSDYQVEQDRNLMQVDKHTPSERELKQKKHKIVKAKKEKEDKDHKIKNKVKSKSKSKKNMKVTKNKKSKKNRKLNLTKVKFESKEDKKTFAKLKQLLKKHGADIEHISNKKIKMIIKKKSKKGRKLWWWWRRHRAEQERRRREAERRRREAERRRREAERRRRMHQGYIRRVLVKREKNYLLELQRAKLKQLDRNKFDKLMQRERKKDSELWSRTFIYDAVLLTEKLIYLEHEKKSINQMKLAKANEAKVVKSLDKYYNKNYGKKLGQLTPQEIEDDIFM